MELAVEVTESHGVKLTATQGPLLVSVIFDVADEAALMKALARAFVEANDQPPHDHPHDDPPPIGRKRKAKV